jgi:iron complex outermembrane recepter protein
MADASTPPLFIERTEVLRGPQGTLHGRNSIGGTMNIISKRPSEDFEGEVRGLVGNYEDRRLAG